MKVLVTVFGLIVAVVALLLLFLQPLDSIDRKSSNAYSELFKSAELIAAGRLRKFDIYADSVANVKLWDFESISLPKSWRAIVAIEFDGKMDEFPPAPFPSKNNLNPLIVTSETEELRTGRIKYLMLLANGGADYFDAYSDFPDLILAEEVIDEYNVRKLQGPGSIIYYEQRRTSDMP
jgi:hypothetical protein